MRDTGLEQERSRLIQRIKTAFKDVTRDHGVSWSESEVIDGYGPWEERLEARARDTDRSWPEFAHNRKWNPNPGYGGFSFLDPIGFRYFLPAAMIRTLADLSDSDPTIDDIEYYLTLPHGELQEWKYKQWSLLHTQQCQCVAAFIRFMIKWNGPRYGRDQSWKEALESHWKKFPSGE